MAEEDIQRRDLWAMLPSIKKGKVWSKAVEELGLLVTQPKGGSSHYAVRLPGYELTDMKGFVTNIYQGMRKDHNEKVFKAILKKGDFKEDQIWRALGMLKDE